MNRNLKLLGVSVATTLAMCMAMGGIASADVLTAEQTPVSLTGSGGKDFFVFDFAEIICTSNKYSGTLADQTSEKVTITPAYSGCGYLGSGVTVQLNGCDYLFSINSTIGVTTGSTEIICPTGKEITMIWPSVGTPRCILHIPPQNIVSGISLTNMGSGSTRELTIDLAPPIKYSQTKGTAEILNCETRDGTSGGFVGQIQLTAESESSGSHVGIFLS
jgi:hypothetical protein